MSNSHNPTNNPNAPRDDDASPIQQPPQYFEQDAVEPHDNALGSSLQSTPEPSIDTSSPQSAATTTKHEASAYVGSYRPSDVQTHTSSVCGCNSSFLHS